MEYTTNLLQLILVCSKEMLLSDAYLSIAHSGSSFDIAHDLPVTVILVVVEAFAAVGATNFE
jgi:hypothetical protein